MNRVSGDSCLQQVLSSDSLWFAMSSGESCLDRGDMSTGEEHGLHGNQNPGESFAGDWKPSLLPVFFLLHHSDLPGQVCYLPPAVKISSQPQPRDNKEG